MGKAVNPASGIQFIIGFPAPAHKGSGAGGSRVQSVLFDKGSWLAGRSWRQGYERAKAWLKDNGFKYDDLDETDDRLHFRQEEPGKFVRFRTITAGGSGDMSKSNPATIGQRVELHPATDAWMQGDRYGTVVGIGRRHKSALGYSAGLIHVKMDRSGKVRKFHESNVMPMRENPTSACPGCGKMIEGSFPAGEYKCSGCGAKVEVK